MTYIVNDNCIACKYTDCVEVCPVDCFYEGENMLVIHPDECIDCGVCEPECPADAIRPDTEPGTESWVEFNRKYSEMWPVIITKQGPLPDVEERDGELQAEYFSEAPGEGGWAGRAGFGQHDLTSGKLAKPRFVVLRPTVIMSQTCPGPRNLPRGQLTRKTNNIRDIVPCPGAGIFVASLPR